MVLSRFFRRLPACPAPQISARRTRLGVEMLESRLAPSGITTGGGTWTGAGSNGAPSGYNQTPTTAVQTVSPILITH
jgi:hypothetical protein